MPGFGPSSFETLVDAVLLVLVVSQRRNACGDEDHSSSGRGEQEGDHSVGEEVGRGNVGIARSVEGFSDGDFTGTLSDRHVQVGG